MDYASGISFINRMSFKYLTYYILKAYTLFVFTLICYSCFAYSPWFRMVCILYVYFIGIMQSGD